MIVYLCADFYICNVLSMMYFEKHYLSILVRLYFNFFTPHELRINFSELAVYTSSLSRGRTLTSYIFLGGGGGNAKNWRGNFLMGKHEKARYCLFGRRKKEIIFNRSLPSNFPFEIQLVFLFSLGSFWSWKFLLCRIWDMKEIRTLDFCGFKTKIQDRRHHWSTWPAHSKEQKWSLYSHLSVRPSIGWY